MHIANVHENKRTIARVTISRHIPGSNIMWCNVTLCNIKHREKRKKVQHKFFGLSVRLSVSPLDFSKKFERILLKSLQSPRKKYSDPDTCSSCIKYMYSIVFARWEHYSRQKFEIANRFLLPPAWASIIYGGQGDKSPDFLKWGDVMYSVPPLFGATNIYYV